MRGFSIQDGQAVFYTIVDGQSTIVVVSIVDSSAIEIPVDANLSIKMVGLTVQEGIAYSIVGDIAEPSKDVLAVPLNGGEIYSIGTAFDYHTSIESNDDYVFVVSADEGTVLSINIGTLGQNYIYRDDEHCSVGKILSHAENMYLWCLYNGRQRLDKISLLPTV